MILLTVVTSYFPLTWSVMATHILCNENYHFLFFSFWCIFWCTLALIYKHTGMQYPTYFTQWKSLFFFLYFLLYLLMQPCIYKHTGMQYLPLFFLIQSYTLKHIGYHSFATWRCMTYATYFTGVSFTFLLYIHIAIYEAQWKISFCMRLS